MALYVQKYGGSSVADAACIMNVARRVLRTKQAGHDVVVVVSAMGDTTDNLIDLARQITTTPDDREMDMLLSTGEQISVALLAMALHALGAEAVSFTGPQAGIFTDSVHRKAKISGVQPERLNDALARGRIVIVAGFQGLTPSSDIATLGRGGSDTTAVALATALKADRCQFCKDVEGVYTANPSVVPRARKLDAISYDEMLELASMGAEVLQSRAVEFAKNHGVVLEVLSSFTEKPGTIVCEEVKTMEDIVVCGVASDKKQAKVTIHHVKNHPGIAARIFQDLAQNHINVDMIVLNVSEEGDTDALSFTVAADDLDKTKNAVAHILKDVGTEATYKTDIAKVSIVGAGMKSHPGVAYTMFSTLATSDINIEMISTSEIKISVLIAKAQADDAVRALHTAFNLDQPASGD